MGLRLQIYDFNEDIPFNIMHSSLPFLILISFVMFVVRKEIGKVQTNHKHNASPIGECFIMFRILQLKLVIFSIIPIYLLFTMKTLVTCSHVSFIPCPFCHFVNLICISIDCFLILITLTSKLL
jgi:hypothetical protein